MKRTARKTESGTSAEARKAGLKRIPRRFITKPGEMTVADCKVKVTMYIDADVLEHFKERAAAPHAAPYQTQINTELRRVMGESKAESVDEKTKLLADERFINALAERVRAQLDKGKKTRRAA